jgi:hypothetical protein
MRYEMAIVVVYDEKGRPRFLPLEHMVSSVGKTLPGGADPVRKPPVITKAEVPKPPRKAVLGTPMGRMFLPR